MKWGVGEIRIFGVFEMGGRKQLKLDRCGSFRWPTNVHLG
jgi:hypothetical protein